jgi:hypothetical protein
VLLSSTPTADLLAATGGRGVLLGSCVRRSMLVIACSAIEASLRRRGGAPHSSAVLWPLLLAGCRCGVEGEVLNAAVGVAGGAARSGS